MPLDLTKPLLVDLDALPVRWVARAELAVELSPFWSRQTVGNLLVVADAGTGDLVRLPWITQGRCDEFRALSPDGRTVLLERGSRWSPRRLCLMELATGDERWLALDPQANTADVFASFSPDGRSLALVLFIDDPEEPDLDRNIGSSVVSVVDMESGASQRLFTTRGFVGFSCGTAWSPDQRLLAATYVALNDEHPEGDFQTVVLQLDGTVVAHIPGDTVFLSPASNGAWLDGHTLLCFGDNGVSATDISTGEAGAIVSPGELLARHGDRLVAYGARETIALDGTDERPWMEGIPAGSVRKLDFALLTQ